MFSFAPINHCQTVTPFSTASLRLRKDDPEYAMQLAKDLKENPKGLDLAFEDFNVYGGSTRGVSSWMLEMSSLTNHIELRLRALVADAKQPIERRIEGGFILWIRSKEQDFAMLDQLFLLVKNPGEASVNLGRRKLAKVFAPEAKELHAELAVSEGNPIAMTLEKFREMSRQPGVIVQE